MRIALLGTRGIPARYGGFETFAEEVATRLAARGHEVLVYGRRWFGEKAEVERYRGVETRRTPTIRHKYLETPVHAVTSFLDLRRRGVDVTLLCNAANSPVAWIGSGRTGPLVINVDGIERRRSKWNAVGKAWYRLGEASSLLFGARVIADARAIAAYYEKTYHHVPEVIAYGAAPEPLPPGPTLAAFSLEPRRYLLYVSRLEPENNALGVIEGYKRAALADLPLVIVGDAPYASEYKERLREAADGADVRFTGFQFGEAYRELQSNAYLYVQATEVGGTHPALVEAMAYGNAVVANGTPENLETLGGAGLFYQRNDFEDLGRKLRFLAEREEAAAEYRSLASERAKERYGWESVTTAYEKLFERLLEERKRGAG